MSGNKRSGWTGSEHLMGLWGFLFTAGSNTRWPLGIPSNSKDSMKHTNPDQGSNRPRGAPDLRREDMRVTKQLRAGRLHPYGSKVLLRQHLLLSA